MRRFWKWLGDEVPYLNNYAQRESARRWMLLFGHVDTVRHAWTYKPPPLEVGGESIEFRQWLGAAPKWVQVISQSETVCGALELAYKAGDNPELIKGAVGFVVELESGVWLDTGDGDPSRTLVAENAAVFDTVSEAITALTDAREFRPFRDACTYSLGDTGTPEYQSLYRAVQDALEPFGNVLSKLESQMARNPELPQSYQKIISEGFAARERLLARGHQDVQKENRHGNNI